MSFHTIYLLLKKTALSESLFYTSLKPKINYQMHYSVSTDLRFALLLVEYLSTNKTLFQGKKHREIDSSKDG